MRSLHQRWVAEPLGIFDVVQLATLMIVAGSLALLFVPTAYAAKASSAMPKLPLIQQVGVIPLQWEGLREGDIGDLGEQKAFMQKAFPEAVRAAHRFRVLNDDLVAGSWNTADGRKELEDQFELHAFAGLNVAPRGDVVVLTARLMDPRLKSLLVEMDTVERSWMINAGEPQIKERIESLVFRLFNRIPVDVSITSVQGPFVTLSGGAEQGIRAGDEVALVRTRVRSLHPANGTWLEFNKENLGVARVIETKNFTSVAKLVKLTQDDAVEVGDGARIDAIAGRVRFARLDDKSGFKDSGEQSSIVVPPVYYDPAEKPSASKTPEVDPTKATDKAAEDGEQLAQREDKPASKAPDAEPAKATKPEPAKPDPASGKDDTSIWDDFKFTDEHDRWLDDAHLYTGPVWWDVSSRQVKDSGKFPLWLFNSIGGGVVRSLPFKFKLAFGGGVMFGETKKSTYVGYDSYGKLYWQDELFIASGLINTWRFGGYGSFSGLSIPKGKFGGGDWVRGGVFAGLGGLVDMQEQGRYDWFGDFALMPLNIGRFGYNGKMQIVESSLGWQLKLGAYQHASRQQIQYGAALGLGDERMTLKNGARPHIQDYSLQGLARYQF